MIIGAAAAAAIGRTASPTTQVYSVNSANLNGSSQYFSGGDVNKVTTNDFSLLINFKTSYTGGNQRVIAKMNSGNTKGYEIYITTSQEIRFRMRTDVSNSRTTTTGNIGVCDGQWHQVLIYSDRAGSFTDIYLDGVSQSVSNSEDVGTVGDIDVTDPFLIGVRANITGYFNGALSFPMVSLTDDLGADITELYNGGDTPCFDLLETATQNKLESYNRLGNYNGNTGQELTDQTGNGNNLTNNGSTPFTETGLSVECTPATTQVYSVNSANLNGSSQSFRSSDILNTSADFSWCGWAKWDAFGGNDTLISDYDASNSGIIIRYRNASNAIRATMNNDSLLIDSSFGALSLDTWYFVALTFSTTSGYSLTVNTTRTTDATTSGFNASRDLYYGQLANGITSQNLDGKLSFYSLWDRTLSESELTSLYNSGTPICYDELESKISGITTNMISFWNMGNYNGNTGQETTDQHGSNNLTNNGSTPFTGTGLNVECT